MEKKLTRRRYKTKRFYSPVKQKILLLLEAGVALSFAGTLGRQIRILGELGREWKDIEKNYLKQIVREFYLGRLVSEEGHIDGTKTIVLTEQGKLHAIRFNFKKMKIKIPEQWDGLWRIVIFDVPEKYKMARIALRNKLLQLGFFQCQKSVYLYPHDCRSEIDFVTTFFRVGRHVRYGVLGEITNEAELLLHFNLRKPIH